MTETSLINLVNPATEETFRTLEPTAESELASVLERMRAAQRKWREVPVSERVEICRGFVDAFRSMKESVALDITRQMGKPLVQARREVDTTLDRAETMLRLAAAALQDDELPPKEGFRRFIRREPLGIVLDIPAWNYPLLIAVNVVIPALLAGNAVLIKHARLTPLCGDAFVDAFRKTSLPPDLVASIHVGHSTVGRLIDRRAVDFVSFTGSVEGGREVYRQASGQLLDMGLELGGKDPALVCEDANFSYAVANLVDGAFYNAGQSCCAVERIYVLRPLFARFLDAYVAEVEKYKVGNPEDSATDIGPLAQRKAVEFMEFQIDQAVGLGARVLTGGSRAPGPGYFFQPTVLRDVDHRMSVMMEESFGPVIGIMPVDNEEEGVRLMNDSPYGLTASIWTEDAARGEALAARTAAGTVYVNRCDYLDPELAWVGIKDSGHGCTLSHLGFLHLTRPKSFHLRTRTIG
ncbi:MAG TPA: aldehyde dehydrogenase family protein [Candidatus Acidoferrales bacterium]|jgi:acyl-CoA reductase-like NAD-dependent aldehyde dehydrogenase|nr:aldehyde dehydrogenase family protein [Candidatus Acidoferrales bacterium]